MAQKGITLQAHEGTRAADIGAVLVTATGMPLNASASVEVYEIPSRKEKIVQMGSDHNYEGDIVGRFVKDATNTARIYVNRLEKMFRDQHKYRISITTHFKSFNNVVLVAYDIQPVVAPIEEYEVSISFVVLNEV